MLNKTKAAMPGRPCHYTKLKPTQDTTLIDQVNRCDLYRIAGGVLTPPLAEFARVCISGVTGIPVSVGYQALPYTLEYYESFVVQPFGSMPCRTNSARAKAFNQLPRLTPSLLAASFICWRSSGAIRIWKVGERPSPLGVLSLLMVDMYVRNPVVWILLCTYVITTCLQKATPRTVGAVPRRLTKPLYEVTIMADIHSNQTRSEFTWRFFALARADLDGEIHRLSVDATTEQEARRVLAPHFILSLAARLPVRGHHA